MVETIPIETKVRLALLIKNEEERFDNYIKYFEQEWLSNHNIKTAISLEEKNFEEVRIFIKNIVSELKPIENSKIANSIKRTLSEYYEKNNSSFISKRTNPLLDYKDLQKDLFKPLYLVLNNEEIKPKRLNKESPPIFLIAPSIKNFHDKGIKLIFLLASALVPEGWVIREAYKTAWSNEPSPIILFINVKSIRYELKKYKIWIY